MKKALISLLLILLLFTLAVPAALAASPRLPIYLNGLEQEVDAFAENGRVLIELDACAEMLQMTAHYHSANREISIHKKRGVQTEQRYSLHIDWPKVFLGGTVYAMLDTPPSVKDGQVYLPLRCAAEIMNADIRWNKARRAVEIDLNYGMYQRNGVWYYDAVPIAELPGYTKVNDSEYLNAQDYWGAMPTVQMLWQYRGGDKQVLFSATYINDYKIIDDTCYVLAQRYNADEKVYSIDLSRPETAAQETNLDWETIKSWLG
ncbi:MAG TPA: copper amine oxidase N-terminal domain-containing protein [Candidatus Avidehalobacter gallistercoris]|uniref:Copper amine oxidase N-terminal domain-containing protein n=1 Tax=Candidatus Avidehalobacter gallistercoris TaxID=2840694 RepID=A0A9D1KZ30_9FIRM|nr:copper amine oxidase N-terminal domain-containing protein [Candidatus Avidehalobacter gallistercoris]